MLKKAFVLCMLTGMLVLTACGEDKKLTVFKENMDQFYTEISAIEESISSIDEQSEDAVASLLIQMEQMAEQFQRLADMEVPEEFISVEELADDAADYMGEAVRLYEEAYEEDYVSDSLIQAAADNYASAMKRVNYIAYLLQDKIPEGSAAEETE